MSRKRSEKEKLIDKKGLGKTLYYPYETSEGILKERISERIRKTLLWEDNCLKGTLFILYAYSNIRDDLTYENIGKEIWWGWRSVKNQMNGSIKKSFLWKYLNQKKEKKRGKQIIYWSLDPSQTIDARPFSDLFEHFCDSYYSSIYGPNIPERKIKNILDTLYPNQFKYTGNVCSENRIGRRCPDFTHKTKKIVIEHFGDFYHGKSITGVPNDIHERDRINEYKYKKYRALIIWEHELGDKEQIKNKIKEFYKKYAI